MLNSARFVPAGGYTAQAAQREEQRNELLESAKADFLARQRRERELAAKKARTGEVCLPRFFACHLIAHITSSFLTCGLMVGPCLFVHTNIQHELENVMQFIQNQKLLMNSRSRTLGSHIRSSQSITPVPMVLMNAFSVVLFHRERGWHLR